MVKVRYWLLVLLMIALGALAEQRLLDWWLYDRPMQACEQQAERSVQRVAQCDIRGAQVTIWSKR